MTNLQETIRTYREYKRMAEEAQAMADSTADELKAVMTAQGKEKLVVGEYKLSYTEAKRETLDMKRLEQDLGDLTEYVKVSKYRVFKVA